MSAIARGVIDLSILSTSMWLSMTNMMKLLIMNLFVGIVTIAGTGKHNKSPRRRGLVLFLHHVVILDTTLLFVAALIRPNRFS